MNRSRNRGLKARPTIYRGVRMRSRLEAAFAASIDARSLEWQYEPVCFASGTTQYLPDFLIIDGDLRTYVEVKPFVDDPAPIQRKMAVIWDSEPDALLNIVCPDGSDGSWWGFDGFWWDQDEWVGVREFVEYLLP